MSETVTTLRLLPLIGLLAFAPLGCDRPTAAAVPAARPAVAAGPCAVRGVVRYAGPRPPGKSVGGDCCPGSPPVPDESVVVNADGTLRNVVVYVKDGPNVASATPNVVLAQIGCRYVPHVLAVRVGQTVVVTSHDRTPHNVHVIPAENAERNFTEGLADARPVAFDRPEPDVLFKCDVHPWMLAHAAVFDHPFFAVTGDAGTFDLDRLPPGSYTLVAWHETLGTVERPFTVSPEHPSATVTLEFHR